MAVRASDIMQYDIHRTVSPEFTLIRLRLSFFDKCLLVLTVNNKYHFYHKNNIVEDE